MIVFLCPKTIGHICPVIKFNSHKDVRFDVWLFVKIRPSQEEVQAMTRDEYLEFITHQPYDAMGDFSFLLDEKADSSENTVTQAVRENVNAD